MCRYIRLKNKPKCCRKSKLQTHHCIEYFFPYFANIRLWAIYIYIISNNKIF